MSAPSASQVLSTRPCSLSFPPARIPGDSVKLLFATRSKSVRALLTPAVLALLVFGGTASAQPKDVAQLYSELKAIENQAAFPLPTPTATLNVGTFDAAKNSFSGLTTSSEDITPGKPPVKMVPVERVNAV